MKYPHMISCFLWSGLMSASFGRSLNSRTQRQSVIIDTDIFGDVDDVGALAVANVLQNCGLADIKGIAVDTPSKYGALAANVITTYFANSDIPIAALTPLTNETYFDDEEFTRSEYASKIASNWPRKLQEVTATPSPLQLYRRILSESKDNSVNIISVGFMTNLESLLKSKGDKYSNLSGQDLVSSKIKELVVMGGQYPSGWEYNFGYKDPQSTAFILENWPKNVSITFSGFELGGNVYTGENLAQNSPPDSPILSAYQWYVGRGSAIRPSWDPITTLYGILGIDGFSKIGMNKLLAYANQDGYNSITSKNGSNAWVNDTSVTNQHYLKLADGVTNSSMAWLLNQFFVHDPAQKTCFGQLY